MSNCAFHFSLLLLLWSGGHAQYMMTMIPMTTMTPKRWIEVGRKLMMTGKFQDGRPLKITLPCTLTHWLTDARYHHIAYICTGIVSRRLQSRLMNARRRRGTFCLAVKGESYYLVSPKKLVLWIHHGKQSAKSIHRPANRSLSQSVSHPPSNYVWR